MNATERQAAKARQKQLETKLEQSPQNRRQAQVWNGLYHEWVQLKSQLKTSN